MRQNNDGHVEFDRQPSKDRDELAGLRSVDFVAAERVCQRVNHDQGGPQGCDTGR